jgi:hypothetical protein
LVLIKGNKWTFRRPLDKIRSITTRGHGAAEKIIFIKLTQHYRIAFTESQCYYKTIADLINGNETERMYYNVSWQQHRKKTTLSCMDQ